jgi:hypothetical protein
MEHGVASDLDKPTYKLWPASRQIHSVKTLRKICGPACSKRTWHIFHCTFLLECGARTCVGVLLRSLLAWNLPSRSFFFEWMVYDCCGLNEQTSLIFRVCRGQPSWLFPEVTSRTDTAYTSRSRRQCSPFVSQSATAFLYSLMHSHGARCKSFAC